jgi:hypothetical protein
VIRRVSQALPSSRAPSCSPDDDGPGSAPEGVGSAARHTSTRAASR